MTEATEDLLTGFESPSIEERREVAGMLDGRRRKKLVRVLKHAGQVELQLDQEKLRSLRESE